jgi:cytochrome c oxidase subunit 2
MAGCADDRLLRPDNDSYDGVVAGMRREKLARIMVIGLTFGLVIAALVARWRDGEVVELHAVMPEKGGWLIPNLTARAGEPLHLRLVSDDVVHGFAIGQSDQPAIDLYPGQPVDLTLVFDKPGSYTFYCTRWCGPDHWRMRGTIVVEGEGDLLEQEVVSSPLYVMLGMDLDAPHEVPVRLLQQPSAKRGRMLGVSLPAEFQDRAYVLRHSPYDAWKALRQLSENTWLADDQVWDLVALAWEEQTDARRLVVGEQLYAQNCAACHGADGRGDGVFAVRPEDNPLTNSPSGGLDQELVSPPDFTDPGFLLGAAPAVLQGKILRGGMGTGMPSWGLIFTEEQTWALVEYLWTFQFEYEE